ncbi:MAG: flavodoxin-dependent (E)-4-hydroxy-3-methylbut-2-enyl-diphosphate synthase [Spirochaetota bacterium]|nr:flavodoxin-dependent (E)-4-hydroxy-3-methylbut-2-enyl-diphosphate synthase [Spirochaetota bacterium]
MKINRKKTKKIKLGNMYIGGDAAISIQSMTNTDTRKVTSTVDQIKMLEKAGCEIIRIAVPNMKAAKVIHQIKQNINIPLIADIHFDYRLALEAIKQGADGLRLNPGNIQRSDKVSAIVEEAKKNDIPIRIGVNAGSVDRTKYPILNPESLVNSALEHINILEALNYYNIKVSIKATDVPMTIESYKLMSEKRDYPLHLGVTEAGTLFRGTIKSSIGIGSLLAMGIGDTFRVSLTADPVEEIKVGKQILESLNIRNDTINLVSCPTCGRCEIDIIGITQKVENQIGHLNKKIKVAVMGCIVNGPGESKDADIGIAGGKGIAVLFKNGKEIRRVKEEDLIDVLIDEVQNYKK